MSKQPPGVIVSQLIIDELADLFLVIKVIHFCLLPQELRLRSWFVQGKKSEFWPRYLKYGFNFLVNALRALKIRDFTELSVSPVTVAISAYVS